MLKTPRIRVCHIIGGLDVGGAERFLFRLIRYMDDQQFETVVISLGELGSIGKELRALGIDVKTIGMTKTPMDFFRFFKLLNILRKIKPDVVQTWLYLSDLIGGVASKLLRIPVLWSVRQSNLDVEVNERLTLLAARISAFLSGTIPRSVIYCAAAAKYSHQRFGYRGRAHVIPNGVNTELYQPNNEDRKAFRVELNISADIILIGMVARHHPQKGHADFINMAAQLAAKHEALRFVLIGEGMDSSNTAITQLLEKNSLENKLLLAGYQRNIPKVMNGLDIYVSASLGEGWPNVLAEAMSCGLPCVATDVGDTKNILGDVGVLAKPACPTDLALGVESFLSLGDKLFEQRKVESRQRIVDNFPINQSVMQYQNLYLSIMDDQ